MAVLISISNIQLAECRMEIVDLSNIHIRNFPPVIWRHLNSLNRLKKYGIQLILINLLIIVPDYPYSPAFLK